MLGNLLASGNFGRKNGSGVNVESVLTSIRREGLFKWLQYAGEINWKATRRHPWLKPFAWIYQIGHYARKGFRSGRSATQLLDDNQRSQSRNELLHNLGIKE